VTTEGWITTGIAVPAVGALIFIAKSWVNAYVSSTSAQATQLVNNDSRQGEITKAFVDHVSAQTKTLGEIALGVARQSELMSQVAETIRSSTAASTEEHKDQWKAISNLCEAVGKNGSG